MHLEFLIEDLSGELLLQALLPRVIPPDSGSSYRIHSFRGIGRIPKGLTPTSDASKRILLDQLPRHLMGYRQTPGIDAIVVVLDLDRRPLNELRLELTELARLTQAEHLALFCIAIEEMEAWLLGDRLAILQAFPDAKIPVLEAYQQDSICGTWEILANAVHKGGVASLKNQPYRVAGTAKCEWASRIAPFMDLDHNSSPSFNEFLHTLRHRLATCED